MATQFDKVSTGMDAMARAKVKDQDLSQEDLQRLVDEFLKDKPNKSFIKEIFQKNGLEYTGDTMAEMATVLGCISKSRPQINLEMKN